MLGSYYSSCLFWWEEKGKEKLRSYADDLAGRCFSSVSSCPSLSGEANKEQCSLCSSLQKSSSCLANKPFQIKCLKTQALSSNLVLANRMLCIQSRPLNYVPLLCLLPSLRMCLAKCVVLWGKNGPLIRFLWDVQGKTCSHWSTSYRNKGYIYNHFYAPLNLI